MRHLDSLIEVVSSVLTEYAENLKGLIKIVKVFVCVPLNLEFVLPPGTSKKKSEIKL